MPDLLAVKKDAQEYESQCEVSATIQKVVGVLATCAALGAAFFAFMGLHRLDRWCSAVVVVLIVWEVFGYGVRHWDRNSTAAQEYRRLAAAIRRGGKSAPDAEAELEHLGMPAVGGLVRMLGSWVNFVQWEGRPGLAAFVRQLVAVLVVLVAIATSIAGAELVSRASDASRSQVKIDAGLE